MNDKTKTPLAATLITGVTAGLFALLLDLEVLADLVSVGSLVCFLLVNAACVWRRYAYQSAPEHAAGSLSGAADRLDQSVPSGSGFSGMHDTGGLAAAMEPRSVPKVRHHQKVSGEVCCLFPLMHVKRFLRCVQQSVGASAACDTVKIMLNSNTVVYELGNSAGAGICLRLQWIHERTWCLSVTPWRVTCETRSNEVNALHAE